MRREFLTGATVLVFGRIFDLWTTWMATPGLEEEVNPVVVYFQWGWTEMIVYAVVLLVLVLLAFYVALQARDRILPDPPASGFLEFMGHVWLGDRTARWALLWGMPRDASRWVFILGATAFVAVTVGSYVAGLNNLMFVLGVHPLSMMEVTLVQAVVAIYGGMMLVVLGAMLWFFVDMKNRHASGMIKPVRPN